MHVGFIGLGDQGAPMATAIAELHMLHVWARREASYAALGDARHERATSVGSLAATVDVLCLCMRGDDDLRQMLFEDWLAESLGEGKVLINHATGDPDEAGNFARRCAAVGVDFLDAPVSGGRPGAVARSLTCFVGGAVDSLERCRSVIACHSSAMPLMGPAGSGQLAKLCNNALTVSNLRNVVEVFGMAGVLGLSLPALQDAFAHSSGGSFILQALGSKVTLAIADHIAELNRKDIREFAAMAEHRGLNARALLDWGLGGPDGLADIVERLSPRGADGPPRP